MIEQDSNDPIFDVAGTSIVVAGAAGGLGSAISLMLAARGARLTLLDSNDAGLAVLAPRLATAGVQVIADITDEAAITLAMKQAVADHGRLDAVVNAAGVLPIASAQDMPLAEFRHCVDVNLSGALVLSRAAAQHMQASGGSIVDIASVSSLVANIDYAAYASSKAALSQLVRVLAREWAPQQIRVNAIGPAMTDTPLTAGYLSNPAFRSQAVAAIPMGRLGTPKDLLAPVLMLLAPGGSFITGQTIYVDGGRTLV